MSCFHPETHRLASVGYAVLATHIRRRFFRDRMVCELETGTILAVNRFAEGFFVFSFGGRPTKMHENMGHSRTC